MKLDKYTVGKRYGKALFELAAEEQVTEAVYHDLLSLKNIYKAIPDLGNMLSDVRLNLNAKRALMDKIVSEFDGITKNFLEVVFRYNRMDDLVLIIDEYERRYDEAQSLVLGTVTTAVTLSDEQKGQLEEKIASLLGYKKANLVEKVDPNILGGVVVEANHQVIDGSVKSRLEQLRAMIGR
ncbi:ATP synthase subunit delta [Enterococcus saigonensis]|uniref:ATP synthase subunit delta n=1 Tax=Enterococcus saigonensis TaxID=1805431 RepID=A0A679IQF6_9ENTE|nr:ATP synthase F1 subunit delta [Enterococcus saigonensis]BCA86174.1 ATP synthase subunit delta [Enterococcus saigonensis]